MERQLVQRPPATPAALAALDPLLAELLARACRTVGDPASGCARVAIVAALGARDPDAFWAACDACAAELVMGAGVEILLAQEDREIRIRVEPFAPADPWAGAPAPGRPPPAGWGGALYGLKESLRRRGRVAGAAAEVHGHGA